METVGETTVTVVPRVREPPGPVQVIWYDELEESGPVETPVVAFAVGLPAPVENPVPSQVSAFVEVHFSLDDCPLSIMVGSAQKVIVGGSAAGATATAAHTPQLLFSTDSVIVPTKEALLSAHARTYQVPEVGKVYETCDTSVLPDASTGDVSVLVPVTVVWSVSLSN